GLRLDVRRAAVELPDATVHAAAWRPLSVEWRQEGVTTAGWWRDEPGWVMAVMGDPATDTPRLLARSP
ncbi:MAG: hypothetical protein ACRDO7_02745, partial [Nocardioidaceae bacterium]